MDYIRATDKWLKAKERYDSYNSYLSEIEVSETSGYLGEPEINQLRKLELLKVALNKAYSKKLAVEKELRKQEKHLWHLPTRQRR